MNKTFNNFKLKIASEIFEAYPDYVASVIYAENLVNAASNEYSVKLLREAEKSARTRFANVNLNDDLHISAWRETFRAFGAKPKKHFCAPEALLRRALSGESTPAINQIVDVYNAVSIKYVIPVGGEDWTKISSDLELIRSKGTEPFATMTSNGEQVDYPSVGEVVWADTSGATVRRWNWRQCFRTRITTETTDAYFVLDRLPPLDIEVLKQASEELAGHLRHLSPVTKISVVLLDRWS